MASSESAENVVTDFRTSRQPCIDLTGTWRNRLGSTMTLKHIGNSNKITGRYSTSVESKEGASAFSSDISGLVQPVDGGSLVAFNVLWNHGDSITAWVGQCLMCEGKEMLYTTWLLRSLKIPIKRWRNTRINQDTFWRVNDDGPQDAADDTIQDVPTPNILGDWKSDTGDSVEITQISEQGLMEGLHKAVDAQIGDSIIGHFDGDETYTALGFASANNKYIKGWTGYIYNPQDTNQIMDTCWLTHRFSNSTNDPRKYVQYGMDNYAKETASAE